jgi:major outer membrane protein
MKKLVVSILTLFACGSAYALPVGNPVEASLFECGNYWGGGGCGAPVCDPCDPCAGGWFDCLNLRIGFYGDYVFNRHLKTHTRLITERSLHQVRLNTNAGYLAVNLFDAFDVFATLGATHARIEADALDFSTLGFSGLFVVDFDTRFSWSVGARATLFEWCRFAVGIEGQYFQFNPRVNFIEEDAFVIIHPERRCTRYQEAQVGFGLAYRYCCGCAAWIPYVAGKWSWERWCFRHEDEIITVPIIGDLVILPRLRNHKHWAFATGLTTTLCDAIGVTVEGRWGDEKAVFVNGQFCF